MALLPITLAIYKKSISLDSVPQKVKFTSCDLRIQALGMALFSFIVILINPIAIACVCFSLYKSRKSNPLDVLITAVSAPIFFAIRVIRYLMGAIIHPGIVYKTENSSEIPEKIHV